jgi:methionyl aminopeptidase
MITIKTNEEIAKMKEAGHINYMCHKFIESKIKVGISTKELNDLADKFIRDNDGIPSFLNYEGFPTSICTSINDEVVHGFPSKRKLKKGDIISIDIGVIYKGYHSDSANTYGVGSISKEKKFLIEHTKASLYEGLKEVKNGVRLGNIGSAIEEYALKHNLGVVKELVGHGVGKCLHEDPDVPNYGKRNTGLILKTGMTVAIEPMLNLGSEKVCILDNNWTVVTEDGSPSAHFEHTVLVTDDGYVILTGE